MREIEFRGKRLDNGEWVYGSLFNTIWRYHEDKSRVCYIFPDDMIDAIDGDNWEDFADVAEDYEVDPATVGQYTGLKDKNGKKIYEGDILRVDFLSHKTEVQYVKDSFMACCKHYINEYLYSVFKESEVIGNIHDNPELITQNK